MFLQSLQFFIVAKQEDIRGATNVAMTVAFTVFDLKNLLHQMFFCHYSDIKYFYCQCSDIKEVSIVLMFYCSKKYFNDSFKAVTK